MSRRCYQKEKVFYYENYIIYNNNRHENGRRVWKLKNNYYAER